MAPLIDPQLCEWDTARFFIFSGNVFANYIYYSHIFPAVSALVLGVLVWIRAPRAPLNISLLAISVFFSIWSYLDLILWATEKTPYTMFFWSILIYFDLLLYAATLYFCYLFLNKRDVPLKMKLAMALPFIPLFFFAHTNYNLIGFDFSNCDREALEGPLWQYVYLVEILFTLSIAALGTRSFLKARDTLEKQQVFLVTLGALVFLFAFSLGNIVGSIEIDWDLGQYGLFGMPVFLAFLSYLIVRYRGFGVKALAAQVLVIMLVILIGAILLIRTIETVRIIAGLTAVLTIILGYVLVRSVKKEVKQREQIEIQEKELEIANKQQETLLHFISHEIKGYLTDGQNAFAAIVEGDVGKVSAPVLSLSETALGKMRQGVRTVLEILDASNMKTGTVAYKKEQFDFRTAVEGSVEGMRPKAAERGLTLDLSVDTTKEYAFTGDKEKIAQHIIRNLIDNAIRYTPQGSIHVALARTDSMIRFSVKDTGVGITPEDKPKLFTEGGHGKDSVKVNVDSTGYGLFVAKQVVEAHGGTIHAESAGAGKGSEFIVELPV